MEPEQITIQHTHQDLLPDRQDAVDLRTRKRGVQKESNLNIKVPSKFLPEHSRQQHQMEVMDPDKIPRQQVSRNSFRKQPIDLLVGSPGIFPEGDFAGVVMDKWPEDAVCARMIKPRIMTDPSSTH